MALKCFDFKCEKCGIFEHFFDTDDEKGEYATCECGAECRRVYVHPPQIDAVAARFWNNTRDPDLGVFTDKAKYHEAVKRSGSTVYEPGLEREAEENNRRYVKAGEEKLRELIGTKVIGNRTLDEVRTMIKNEAKMAEAQKQGDIDTITKMGGYASLDDAYKAAPPTPVAEYIPPQGAK